MKMMLPLTVRLFLVRHGTTDANKDGIIVGQSDSRLTIDGIRQAIDLGKDPVICNTNFWRKCTSDLCRAQQTTALILQLNDGTKADDDDDKKSIVERINVKTVDFSRNTNIINTMFTQVLMDNNVLLETKLRETAKGVRQGYPKTMNIHEVMEEREKNIQDHINDDTIPILETTDDGWKRISSWLGQIILDAWEEETIQTLEIRTATNHITKNVLAVCHSGILRTFLSRLVGDTRLREHPTTQYDKSNVLFIPNTSLTIIDVHISVPTNSNSNTLQTIIRAAFQNYDERIGVHVNTADFGLSCDIVEMAAIRHYQV